MTPACSTYYRHSDIATSGALTHRYYVRDYLGSVRAVFDLYGNLEQTTDYNVTGIPSSRHLGNADVHKHTGKEFQGFNGLAWYDNNARYYDPILARFTTQDPLAEIAPWNTPYAHCSNNSINRIDPLGLFDTEAEAEEYSKKYGNAPVLQDKNTGDWFISLNAERNGPYISGNIVTRFFGPEYSPIYSMGLFMGSLGTSYFEHTQYNEPFGIWRGKNNKIYTGLSGKGPNQYTGSRSYAKLKSTRIGYGSKSIGLLNMGITLYNYNSEKQKGYGPNMRTYLTRKHTQDQVVNGIGFAQIWGAVASLSYNFGYIIESVGQFMFDNPNFRIRINPYTGDFTPIEQTLQEYDEKGIYVY